MMAVSATTIEAAAGAGPRIMVVEPRGTAGIMVMMMAMVLAMMMVPWLRGRRIGSDHGRPLGRDDGGGCAMAIMMMVMVMAVPVMLASERYSGCQDDGKHN